MLIYVFYYASIHISGEEAAIRSNMYSELHKILIRYMCLNQAYSYFQIWVKYKIFFKYHEWL